MGEDGGVNLATAGARAVVEQLIAGGVVDVVLAPGSRSAPLAFALAAADRQGMLKLHTRIDERAAAYLALGLAKETHRPTAVVCTSGTAVANFAPAVVEAMHSGVPLVVITADRPPALRKVGANQVIDQVGFFGQQVRTSVDVVPMPQEVDPVGRWRQVTDRIIADSMGTPSTGGAPVHLNLAFVEPLVPDPGDEDFSLTPDVIPMSSPGILGSSAELVDAAHQNSLDPMQPGQSREPSDQPVSKPVTATPDRAESFAAAQLREPINYVIGDLGLDTVPTRGLVVVGDIPDPQVSQYACELAESCGWPLIAEPSANCSQASTFIASANLFLADEDFLQSHLPEVVITIGRVGLSRPVMKLISSAKLHVSIWAAGKDRPDPMRTASLQLTAVPRPVINDEVVRWQGPDDQWLAEWQQRSLATVTRVDRVLGSSDFTGVAVARQVWESAAADDVLLVASSRAVRNLEAVITPRPDVPFVVGNRGASGIDGLVSTATGIALAHQRTHPNARTYALLGDLAFLHDFNGFLIPPGEDQPQLTVIVADNNGGGIFSSLEQGDPRFTPDFERIFGTPHGHNLAAMTRALGLPTTEATSSTELDEVLRRRPSGIEVIIAKTADRAAEQMQWRQLLTRH